MDGLQFPESKNNSYFGLLLYLYSLKITPMTTYNSIEEAKKSQFISIPSYEEKVVELIEKKIKGNREQWVNKNTPESVLKELLLEIKLLNN